MPKVRFISSLHSELAHVPAEGSISLNKEVEIRKGETLFKAARVNGIPIGSSCRGDCVCGWCKVEIVLGMENLSQPKECEKKLMKSGGYEENERAACGARVLGDVTVTTGYW
ncbi:MAG: 2Fe-2S iron-sulfur cluster-binding protein [Candidatus Kryptoniota bacterium]